MVEMAAPAVTLEWEDPETAVFAGRCPAETGPENLDDVLVPESVGPGARDVEEAGAAAFAWCVDAREAFG